MPSCVYRCFNALQRVDVKLELRYTGVLQSKEWADDIARAHERICRELFTPWRNCHVVSISYRDKTVKWSH
ncbi:hypothetical protein EVJ58_g1154 [Rhodofomes roseus]|uniref:Uncharacterized protein n=1 Tax=Rhodofomes roseus TaxID=34475 RepID=A0A4Y9Z473_9APHY|nr:hypothetical protein EVJ58_g1154 [Rhodofomes roseus]